MNVVSGGGVNHWLNYGELFNLLSIFMAVYISRGLMKLAEKHYWSAVIIYVDSI